VLPDGRHVFLDVLLPVASSFFLLPVAPFWYFRELNPSLITRSIVELELVVLTSVLLRPSIVLRIQVYYCYVLIQALAFISLQ